MGTERRRDGEGPVEFLMVLEALGGQDWRATWGTPFSNQATVRANERITCHIGRDERDNDAGAYHRCSTSKQQEHTGSPSEKK